MTEIAKMANLSKTQVSLEQLIKGNKVECIQKKRIKQPEKVLHYQKTIKETLWILKNNLMNSFQN